MSEHKRYHEAIRRDYLIVNREDVLAFIEIRNTNIYSELYVIITGQYYLLYGYETRKGCVDVRYLVR